MHIEKIVIQNIRSIQQFEMHLPQASLAGWHVLIGDNGAGKSSIIRSIALALIGPQEMQGLRADWRDWLNKESTEGKIQLEVWAHDIDQRTGTGKKLKNYSFPNQINFKRSKENVSYESNINNKDRHDPANFNWGSRSGWFSVAYGPYRRFEGGNQDWAKVFYSQPKLGAHLSAFGEDVALTEAIDWLVKLNYQVLEKKESSSVLDNLKKFVNVNGFLPHKAQIESISSDGVFFKDGNGALVHVNQLSDGYRSILSLTFELIRQLVRVYGADKVFKDIQNSKEDEMKITLTGVVLIDEVDAHLHPTWQTRIGQWFTKYFPNIQFIVTTHSPLVCRACEKGTIWRLAAPGSNIESGQVTGIERDRLVNGNILDAYGTEIFGQNISISQESNEKINRLAELNIKSLLGEIEGGEQDELIKLKTTFPTEKVR